MKILRWIHDLPMKNPAWLGISHCHVCHHPRLAQVLVESWPNLAIYVMRRQEISGRFAFLRMILPHLVTYLVASIQRKWPRPTRLFLCWPSIVQLQATFDAIYSAQILITRNPRQSEIDMGVHYGSEKKIKSPHHNWFFRTTIRFFHALSIWGSRKQPAHPRHRCKITALALWKSANDHGHRTHPMPQASCSTSRLEELGMIADLPSHIGDGIGLGHTQAYPLVN